MTRLKVGFSLAIALLVTTTAQSIATATVTSTPFSFGYGRTGKWSDYPPTYFDDPNYTSYSEWNELEANADPYTDPNTGRASTVPASDPANMPHTQGDFTFDVTLGATSGTGNWSTGGPTFVDRVIDSSAHAEYSANGSTFTVDIDGSVAPAALPEGSSNPQTRLEITSISLWATDGRVTGMPLGSLLDKQGDVRWAEVTPGNEGTSPFLILPTCTSVTPDCDTFGVLGAATHYGNLVWNPPDPDTGAAGFVADTRTFNFELGTAASASDTAVDGFEIFGLVHLDFSSPCDFDASGTCGLADINLMFQQGDIAVGVVVDSGNQFDLDSDNNIDGGDITEWLSLTGTTNGYSSPMLRGDTDSLGNLSPANRTVDITDFQNFLAGFTGAGSKWEVGNFDGNGVVDITDFSSHFLPSFIATGGGTYGPGQAIPEPSTVLLIGLGGLLLSFLLKWHPRR